MSDSISLLMSLTDGPECAPVMTITWTDYYQMYGTKEFFNKGGGEYTLYIAIVTFLICARRPVVVGGSSVARDIKFGQRYNLPNWTTSSVIEDPEAPAHGFIFNNGVKASSVICMKEFSTDGSTSKNVPGGFLIFSSRLHVIQTLITQSLSALLRTFREGIS